MKFDKPRKVGDGIGALLDTPYLGYDHNYVIDKHFGKLGVAAVVKSEKSGRTMKVTTTAPGVQLYTGNFLFGQEGKSGHKYEKQSALCLETQWYPNSANIKHFPPIFIGPGEEFKSFTAIEFGVEK